ncbi:hypothetical protein VINE108521_06975 [Vibrio neonatus]
MKEQYSLDLRSIADIILMLLQVVVYATLFLANSSIKSVT